MAIRNLISINFGLSVFARGNLENNLRSEPAAERVGLQQQWNSFSAVHIFLSVTAFLGNFLILVALNKETSFIHHRNSYIVVWQQLICWLVLLPMPASCCYLLNTLGSRTLESLSICKGRGLHIKLCIMFRVFVDVDGHKRGHLSLCCWE